MGSVIVMTGDLVFDEELEFNELCCHPGNPYLWFRLVENAGCCLTVGYFISLPCTRTGFMVPSLRNGVTFAEFILLILFAIFYDDGARLFYLLSPVHGLIIFVASIVCFLICLAYAFFFPLIRLPGGVGPFSKYGIAFNGE